MPDEDVEAIINCNPGSVEETLYSLMRHLKKFESGELRLSQDESELPPPGETDNDVGERKISLKSNTSKVPGSPRRERSVSPKILRNTSEYGNELVRMSSSATDDRITTKKSSRHVDIDRSTSTRESPLNYFGDPSKGDPAKGDPAKLTSKNVKRNLRGENRDLLKEMIVQKEIAQTRERALTDASRVLEPAGSSSMESASCVDASESGVPRMKISRSNTVFTGEGSPKNAKLMREKDERIKALEEKVFLIGLELEKLQQIINFKDSKIASLEEQISVLEDSVAKAV